MFSGCGIYVRASSSATRLFSLFIS
ncbi:hypothetical protein FEQ43_23135 [Salmonella enterica]|nr:hypothetical protein [Salmonella enterica]EAA8931042.1 hypothetical protein [Salmonella enterica subsp. enterica serovar Gaminara]EAA9480866.1 hypothetical protein [Salmonella enterica subsp. enterica]EAA9578530.1 hypothetical protein [Salmonella enterica subsp. enterica serovar Oranienburg]EAS6829336.1 hypothetical protein [Salmonella enterica subsp. enterica serovar Give]EAU5117707.1 hypothetical protein [Salmonella enterica subsp. enterica serovar Montevideo]EBL5541400.1 hypothetical pr